jgi:tetratricopeptide (TPR) repeat protein
MANFSTSISVVARLGALCAALTAADAKAFNAEQAQPAATARSEQKANVVVFDNAYLDRRFGRNQTRATETSSNQEHAATAKMGETGHAVSAFFGADFAAITPNSSLLKGITRGTSARRAAGLRLAENGRKAFEKKQYQKAVYYLEKALSIDASPFVHFYLARAHYQLADYRRALQFLEVAESAFDGHDPWVSELAALRRALLDATVATREALKRSVGWTHKD